MEPIPPDVFLASYPPPIRALADRLREVVAAAVPEVVERVRPGWRLIGFDAPARGRLVYFAYVAPESGHVHLGFEHGLLMRDPNGVLEGAGITRRVRWLTWRPGARVDEGLVASLVLEGLRVARMSRGERFAAAMARQDAARRPDGSPATALR